MKDHGRPQKNIVSPTEAAQMKGVTRQAISRAIMLKKLKSHKFSGRHWIKIDDLEEYYRNKHSRKLFDNKKGFYSAPQAAKILEVSTHRIYEWIRRKKLKSSRIRGFHALHIDDIIALKISKKKAKSSKSL